METMGARVINELYVSHLFSLALSLHGGTESFTYPYGTPNHMISSGITVPKLKMEYDIKNGKAENPHEVSVGINDLKMYRKGGYDMTTGKSTEPPDANMLKGKLY